MYFHVILFVFMQFTLYSQKDNNGYELVNYYFITIEMYCHRILPMQSLKWDNLEIQAAGIRVHHLS